MREYWRFFRRETPLLSYGVSLTFLSSVGQTFLVSLFVPHFLTTFSLSEAALPLLVRLLPRSGVELDPREAAEDGGRQTAPSRAADAPAGESDDEGDAEPWGAERTEVLRDPVFWCALPAALLPAFWVTGFFLYQTAIAGTKGSGSPCSGSWTGAGWPTRSWPRWESPWG